MLNKREHPFSGHWHLDPGLGEVALANFSNLVPLYSTHVTPSHAGLTAPSQARTWMLPQDLCPDYCLHHKNLSPVVSTAVSF